LHFRLVSQSVSRSVIESVRQSVS